MDIRVLLTAEAKTSSLRRSVEGRPSPCSGRRRSALIRAPGLTSRRTYRTSGQANLHPLTTASYGSLRSKHTLALTVGSAAGEECLVSRGRVLLVEDEFLVRLILGEALAEAGYEVVEADGGEAGVRLIDEGGPFDVVITDVQMPGPADGIAV